MAPWNPSLHPRDLIGRFKNSRGETPKPSLKTKVLRAALPDKDVLLGRRVKR